MYKDKTLDKNEYINDVHAMTYDEAQKMISGIKYIGSYYWLSSTKSQSELWRVSNVNFYGKYSY